MKLKLKRDGNDGVESEDYLILNTRDRQAHLYQSQRQYGDLHKDDLQRTIICTIILCTISVVELTVGTKSESRYV